MGGFSPVNQSLANAFLCSRNCHCLHHRRCPLLLRTRPSLPRAALSTSEHPSPSHKLRRTLSQTRSLYSHRRVTAMALDSLACIQHQLLKLVALEVGRPILQAGTRLVPHPTAIALEYCLLQTQLLVAACLRKTKMWPYN